METEHDQKLRTYYIVLGLALQLVLEVVAHALQIWEITYAWWWPVAVLWGAVLGGVTFYLRDSSLFALYLAGLVLAGFPEIPNAALFDLWRYPDDRILFIAGRFQVALFMAFLWGLICPIIRATMKILQRLNWAPLDSR
jgi:hypothetical protein